METGESGPSKEDIEWQEPKIEVPESGQVTSDNKGMPAVPTSQPDLEKPIVSENNSEKQKEINNNIVRRLKRELEEYRRAKLEAEKYHLKERHEDLEKVRQARKELTQISPWSFRRRAKLQKEAKFGVPDIHQELYRISDPDRTYGIVTLFESKYGSAENVEKQIADLEREISDTNI